MLGTIGKVKTDSKATLFYKRPHVDSPLLTDKQTFTFLIFVRTLNVVYLIFQEQYKIRIDKKLINEVLWNGNSIDI